MSGEIVIPNIANPLREAIKILGGSDVLQSSDDLKLTTVKFPKEDTTDADGKFIQRLEGCYVTGLTGHVKRNTTVRIETPVRKSHTLKAGESWCIRWDYDPAKGPHVNASFGSSDAMKLALQKDTSFSDSPKNFYWEAIIDMSRRLGFETTYKGTRVGLGFTKADGSREERDISERISRTDAKMLAEDWAVRYDETT